MNKPRFFPNLIASAVFLAVLASCATSSAPPPSTTASVPPPMTIPNTIQWQGTPYQLAWTNDANGVAILEYLTGGQTTENWETMITVQLSGESAAKAVSAFIDRTKPYRTEDARIMKNDDTGDLLVDCLLFDTANDFLEHNLVKFSKLKDGRLVKVFFQTRVKLSEATKDKTLVSEKIGKPRVERLNFLATFPFP